MDFDALPASVNRRKFIQYSLSTAALAGVVPFANASPNSDAAAIYKRAIVIDTLMPEEGPVDAAAGVAAGFTAAVLDIKGYPRDAASAAAAMERWQNNFEVPGSRFLKVLTGADIRKAKADSKFGIILASQDASILGVPAYSSSDTNIKALETLHKQGLRVLQITHSDRNGLGDSYMEPTNAGLSLLGRAVVGEMNKHRMLIDLSHCGEATSMETIQLSSRPCAFTHMGCRTLMDTPRNKTDEAMKALANKGGYIGIFNMSVWLTRKDVPTIDDLIDHIDHAVNVAGIDHVGFGSDKDLDPKDLDKYLSGFREYYNRTKGRPGLDEYPKHVMIPELYSIHRMERIAFALAKRGRPDAEIEKILGGNFARIFEEVCG